MVMSYSLGGEVGSSLVCTASDAGFNNIGCHEQGPVQGICCMVVDLAQVMSIAGIYIMT